MLRFTLCLLTHGTVLLCFFPAGLIHACSSVTVWNKSSTHNAAPHLKEVSWEPCWWSRWHHLYRFLCSHFHFLAHILLHMWHCGSHYALGDVNGKCYVSMEMQSYTWAKFFLLLLLSTDNTNAEERTQIKIRGWTLQAVTEEVTQNATGCEFWTHNASNCMRRVNVFHPVQCWGSLSLPVFTAVTSQHQLQPMMHALHLGNRPHADTVLE